MQLNEGILFGFSQQRFRDSSLAVYGYFGYAIRVQFPTSADVRDQFFVGVIFTILEGFQESKKAKFNTHFIWTMRGWVWGLVYHETEKYSRLFGSFWEAQIVHFGYVWVIALIAI